MNIIRTFALPLVVGAVVVGGAAYIAKKNSSKVISMVDAVRTWINKKLSKNVAEAEIAKRRSVWKAPEPRYTRGVQAKFAFNASTASKGAVLDDY